MLNEKSLDEISERAKNAKFHKDSFNCHKCPRNGCPAWMDITWTMFNDKLKVHAEKRIEGCSFVLQPIFTTDMISNNYRTIDASQQIHNDVRKVIHETETRATQIKQGILALLKMVGTKDIVRVFKENQELKKQLEEGNVNG